jgi:hypothetical protein
MTILRMRKVCFWIRWCGIELRKEKEGPETKLGSLDTWLKFDAKGVCDSFLTGPRKVGGWGSRGVGETEADIVGGRERIAIL